jgi:RHS repeat-associated protein
LPLGFTGEQRDAESGLVSLRARYLDPATGRFLTKDPSPGGAADPASQQPYPYAHNAPTALTDPGGMSPFASLGGAGQSGAGGDASLCGGDDLVSLLLSDPRDLVTGEQIKAALGVLSLVPGLGTPASAVGALLYAADGDYANAALAGLGVIPLAGVAAKPGVGALPSRGGLLAAHGIGHVGFAAGGSGPSGTSNCHWISVRIRRWCARLRSTTSRRTRRREATLHSSRQSSRGPV